MNSLLKTALHWTLGFLLLVFFSPLLFVLVERTEEDDLEEKYQLLHSLYESTASKYNVSIEEFNNFSSVAYKALSMPKPQWTYLAACDFVFQAITTIGKVKCKGKNFKTFQTSSVSAKKQSFIYIRHVARLRLYVNIY